MATSSTVTMGEGGESNDRLSTRCPNSLAGMVALRWLRWSQQPGGRQTRKGPLCKRLPYAFGSSSRRSRPRPSARGHLKRLPATRALSVTCLGRAVRRRCDEPRQGGELTVEPPPPHPASQLSRAIDPCRSSPRGPRCRVLISTRRTSDSRVQEVQYSELRIDALLLLLATFSARNHALNLSSSSPRGPLVEY